MWWDLSAIACALAALAIRSGWDDDRAPGVAACTAYLSTVCSAWSSYRRRWLRRAEGD